LYLGDCHAIQGDLRRMCGVALEHPTVTTVQVDLLIKKWNVQVATPGKREVLHDDRFQSTRWRMLPALLTANWFRGWPPISVSKET